MFWAVQMMNTKIPMTSCGNIELRSRYAYIPPGGTSHWRTLMVRNDERNTDKEVGGDNRCRKYDKEITDEHQNQTFLG